MKRLLPETNYQNSNRMHFGIIAAGEGSRLASEGVSQPKPLLPICGEPMIGRLIRIFEKAGAASINVVTNGFMPEVKEYLDGLKERLTVPLNIRIKTTPSSMHTFYELSHLIPDRGRFIATTVDTIFREEDFLRYVEAFKESPEEIDGLMAVTDFIEDEKPLYVSVDGQMDITGFHDEPYPGFKYISGGVYGLDGKAVDVLDKCMEQGVSRMRNFQRKLVETGLRIKAFPMGKIIDVDHAGDIGRAEEFLGCLK